MKMISSLNLKADSDFKFGTIIKVKKAVISKQIYQSHFQKFKKSFPDENDEDIQKRVNNLVLKEYFIGAVFDFLIPLFDFEINQEELEKNINTFKKNTQNLSADKKENTMIFHYIERLLKQQLIINYFVDNFEKKLYPTKQEAIEVLENYYKQTNKSIRELKSDSGLNIIKDTICQERFIDWMKTKYKIIFDVPKNFNNSKDLKIVTN